MITRRQVLTLLGSVAGTALLATSFPALAQNPSAGDLAAPGPLGDVAQGPRARDPRRGSREGEDIGWIIFAAPIAVQGLNGGIVSQRHADLDVTRRRLSKHRERSLDAEARNGLGIADFGPALVKDKHVDVDHRRSSGLARVAAS